MNAIPAYIYDRYLELKEKEEKLQKANEISFEEYVKEYNKQYLD